MTMNSIANHAKEFSWELTKAVSRQALAIAPFAIGSKVCQLVGYDASFTSLVGGFTTYTAVGFSLKSCANLAGMSSSADRSLKGRVKDLYNVGAGAALLAHAIAPSLLTATAVGTTIALSGLSNLCHGAKEIKEGLTATDHNHWKKIAEGIVISTMGAFSLKNGLSALSSILPQLTEEQAPIPQINEEPVKVVEMRFAKASQSILKCPTNEVTCNKNNLQSSLNYLCEPGRHTVKSVVVGSRTAELEAVKTKMKSEISLKKFEKSLYRRKNFTILPTECKKISDEVGNEMFSRYLDKYRHCGLNEKNAIDWVEREPFYEGVTHVYTIENESNTWCVHATVETNGLLEPDKYFPPSITAYHELMHVEEIPRFSQRTKSETGDELLTTLTTLMQLDEAFKKCKKLNLSTEVNYQRSLEINSILIPIGKVANCYRYLTSNFGKLVDAVLSDKSINFIKTGVCQI